MKDCQRLLGVEISIGNPARDDRRRECTDGIGEAKNPADLPGCETQSVKGPGSAKIIRKIRIPHSADGIFQEHHDAQPEGDGAMCHERASKRGISEYFADPAKLSA